MKDKHGSYVHGFNEVMTDLLPNKAVQDYETVAEEYLDWQEYVRGQVDAILRYLKEEKQRKAGLK